MAISLFMLCIVALYFVFSPKTEKVGAKPHLSKGRSHCVRFSSEVSKADGDKNEEIIYTVSHKGSFSLFMKQGHLQSLGASLNDTVPPFTFLSYIFSRPCMVRDMAKIRANNMKYNHFVGGLYHNLMSEYEKKCLFEHARAFSRHLGLNEDEVTSILKQCCDRAVATKSRKAFKPFVNYLIDKKFVKDCTNAS